MGAKRCKECGAQLRLRSTSCPLCGTGEETDAPKAPGRGKSETSVVNVDDYQSDIRKLREELRRLRDAEAS
jgi:hypothetical protein